MKGFKRKIISNHLKFMSLYVSIDAYVGYVSMHKSTLRNRIGQQLMPLRIGFENYILILDDAGFREVLFSEK